MITCVDCRHHISGVCVDCKGFDKAQPWDEDDVVYTITDNVNHPSHYADRKFETIDVIEDCIKANKLDGYQGYLYGNVIKYISRLTCKGDALDNAKKAQWYLNRLIEVRENEKVHG